MFVHVLRVLVYPGLCLGINLFFRPPLAPWELGPLFVLMGGLMACFDAFFAMMRTDPEAEPGGRLAQAWGVPALGLCLGGVVAGWPLVWFPLVSSALCAALGLALTRRLAPGRAVALGYGTLALWLTVPWCPLHVMVKAALYRSCCPAQMAWEFLLVSVAWAVAVTCALVSLSRHPLVYVAALLGVFVPLPYDDYVWWLRMCAMCALTFLAVLHTLALVVRGGPSAVPAVGLCLCLLALVPLDLWRGFPGASPLTYLLFGLALCVVASRFSRVACQKARPEVYNPNPPCYDARTVSEAPGDLPPLNWLAGRPRRNFPGGKPWWLPKPK